MAMKQLQGLMKPLKKHTKMTLKSLFSRRSKGPVKEPVLTFMNVILMVDDVSGWAKKLTKVLSGIKGPPVSFRMRSDGLVEISGEVEALILLKRLGKVFSRDKIVNWQFGQCASKLYPGPNPYGINYSSYDPYGNINGYDYGSYGGSSSHHRLPGYRNSIY